MQISSAAAFLLSFLPLLHFANGRCYLPESGLTLTGHDYRRLNDLGEVVRCARECLSDCACMGFVWFKNGTCTLKSLSLDSGVSASEDARFGLCVNEDYDGRDRLWDHEFTGDDIKIHMKVHRDECADMCLREQDGSTLYTWTPNHLKSLVGMCRCKGRMTGVRLRFGATCGFLDRN